nr:6293_t:CDS:2 [Entrophospora candida]
MKDRKEYFHQYNKERARKQREYYQKYHQEKKFLVKEAQIPWQKQLVLEYWRKHIKEVPFQPKLTTNFFVNKSFNIIELQNWKKYGDIKKGIITFRHGNIRVKDKSNSVDIKVIRDFVKDNQLPKNIKFLDLFCGIGGFHSTLKDYGECVLANDINKSCRKVYQLNFPTTPFLLGDINNQEIQKKIIATEFDLLCAGFPCQPYSKANKNKGQSDEVIDSLREIIEKKQPKYVLLENVPQMKENTGKTSTDDNKELTEEELNEILYEVAVGSKTIDETKNYNADLTEITTGGGGDENQNQGTP